MYEDEGLVEYPAAYTRTENEEGEIVEEARFENISLNDWTENQARSAALEEVRNNLEEELGELEGVATGQTANEVSITYFTYEEAEQEEPDRDFTYIELEQETPEEVETTIHFEDHTDTITVPVEANEGPAPQPMGEQEYDYSLDHAEGEAESQPILERIISTLKSLMP